MKKIWITITAVLLAVTLCGCNETQENSTVTDDNTVSRQTVAERSEEPVQESVINRNQSKEVVTPNGSITYQEACSIVDQCGMRELELPQSAKDYQKYYFDTVSYYGDLYYSIYLYVEKDKKKVFVGNNILVSCDGKLVLKKDWLGHYEKVSQNGADSDPTLEELYPSAKTTPVEAAKALADKNLGLEYGLSQCVFEFAEETTDIQSINCFVVTPKVELTDSTKYLKKIYINTDGSGQVFQADPNEKGEYIELQ